MLKLPNRSANLYVCVCVYNIYIYITVPPTTETFIIPWHKLRCSQLREFRFFFIILLVRTVCIFVAYFCSALYTCTNQLATVSPDNDNNFRFDCHEITDHVTSFYEDSHILHLEGIQMLCEIWRPYFIWQISFLTSRRCFSLLVGGRLSWLC